MYISGLNDNYSDNNIDENILNKKNTRVSMVFSVNTAVPDFSLIT